MGKLSLIKKILILVLILALPGFLYYLLTVKGKNRYHALAKFGPKEIAKTTHRVKGKDVPDTIYHTLSDFKLTVTVRTRQVSYCSVSVCEACITRLHNSNFVILFGYIG